jgi:hypothetical protein
MPRDLFAKKIHFLFYEVVESKFENDASTSPSVKK